MSVDANLTEQAALDRQINLVTSELNTLRYRDNPMFIVARNANDRLSVSVHADDNFMFTLVCALAEKICKDNGMEPTRLCVQLMDALSYKGE